VTGRVVVVDAFVVGVTLVVVVGAAVVAVVAAGGAVVVDAAVLTVVADVAVTAMVVLGVSVVFLSSSLPEVTAPIPMRPRNTQTPICAALGQDRNFPHNAFIPPTSQSR
jgi:hypothetical protein